MAEHDDPRGKDLFDLDPRDPALREKYGAALHDQLDRHMPGALRARYAVVGLAGLAGCLVCGSLAITEPATLRPAVRGLLFLFAFFGLGWMIFSAWVLARGRGNFVAQRTVAARMAFGFTLTSVIALAFASSVTGRSAVGMPMIASGIALLILAAVFLIDARIERSESAIREQILRVESRLVGLAGSIEGLRSSREGEG